MKVLHITTIDTGGAYKAAYRLHKSLQLQEVESEILVRTKLNPKSEVKGKKRHQYVVFKRRDYV